MTYPLDIKVLALDLATTTGFAFLGNGIITSGTQSFKRKYGRKTITDDHVGKSYIDFQVWLRDKLHEYGPHAIVFEEPMGHFQSSHARNVVVGLRGVLMVNAAYYRIPVFGYVPTTLKKFATGKGNADKDLMLATALLDFPDLEVQDHNEADAIFLLHLYLREKAKQE